MLPTQDALSGTHALMPRYDELQQLDAADDDVRLCEAATVAMPQSVRELVLRTAPPKPHAAAKLLQIIRPGIGGGRGTRYYGPQMLESHAHVFAGARMFKDHETDKQRRAREGLPRPMDQVGGRIAESWWNGDVPATDRFEQGGVYGWTIPTPDVGSLIEHDPELIESSINALATRTHGGRVGGRSVSIVEGIRSKPIAVDWIAGEGGAGGMVLTEAAEEEAVFESMTDAELEVFLVEERPGLIEALRESGTGGDDVGEFNAAALAEVLATEEGRNTLIVTLRESGPELQLGIAPEEVQRMVEAQVAERLDLALVEGRAESDRQVELRDMRDKARALIEAADLSSEKLTTKLIAQFGLDEAGVPSPALNLGPVTDGDGNVTKTAMQVLTEAVEAELEDAREILGEARPTRVTGQGGGAAPSDKAALVESAKAEHFGTDDPEEKKPKVKPRRFSTGSPLTDELMESAGFGRDALPTIWATG